MLVAGVTRLVIYKQTIAFAHKHPMLYFTDLTCMYLLEKLKTIELFLKNCQVYTSSTFFWILIEVSMGVIGACLPTLRPLFIHPQEPKSLGLSHMLPSQISKKFRKTGFEQYKIQSSVNSNSTLKKIVGGDQKRGFASKTQVESVPPGSLQDSSLPGFGIWVQHDFTTN